MKKILLLVLFTMVWQFSNAKYLIKEGDKFVPKEWATDSMSLSDVAKHLGYNDGQFLIYSESSKNDTGINFVMMKIISSEVLFLSVDKKVTSVSEAQVKEYLSNYKYEDEVTNFDYTGILKDAIKDKNFSLNFMLDALCIPHSENCKDTIVTDTKNRYEYIFKDGILTEFIPTDGLGYWARFFKEGNYFPKMEAYAKKYWKTNTQKILWELNTISDAWAVIPKSFKNEYCYMFAENDGEICNSKVMTIALYGDTNITEQEFKDITHNKAVFDGAMTYYGKNCHRYSYKSFYFLFTPEGEFFKVIEK